MIGFCEMNTILVNNDRHVSSNFEAKTSILGILFFVFSWFIFCEFWFSASGGFWGGNGRATDSDFDDDWMVDWRRDEKIDRIISAWRSF